MLRGAKACNHRALHRANPSSAIEKLWIACLLTACGASAALAQSAPANLSAPATPAGAGPWPQATTLPLLSPPSVMPLATVQPPRATPPSMLPARPAAPDTSNYVPLNQLPPGQQPFGPTPMPGPCFDGCDEEEFSIEARYKYNFGGGYLSVFTPDEEFSLNLQNEVTLDGTFFDRPDMPTAEKGFNIPFLRTYLFGNVTENWQYQIATQSFLGQFNILDAFINWRFDDRLNIRAGRGLSPFLYEYYAFSPAWEPVINNSVLFQLAGKRQEGVMAWGNVRDKTIQYQAGIFNGISGAFYDLDRAVDFLGSLFWTPFADTESGLASLGIGGSVQTGDHHYALNQTGSAWTNGAGEPTTNINYITSSGIPFFQYNTNTQADGNQTKFAPCLFWFGRFSVLTEYLHCTRRLSSGPVSGDTAQSGFYINTSYFLTGERYTGNGLAGYTTISPLNPYRPGRGQCGPGAWEVACQISQLSLSNSNFAFTNTPNNYASRCDQLMLGLNWWPNKYTRLSLDNVWTWFDRAIPLGPNPAVGQFNTVWCRVAMFF